MKRMKFEFSTPNLNDYLSRLSLRDRAPTGGMPSTMKPPPPVVITPANETASLSISKAQAETTLEAMEDESIASLPSQNSDEIGNTRASIGSQRSSYMNYIPTTIPAAPYEIWAFIQWVYDNFDEYIDCKMEYIHEVITSVLDVDNGEQLMTFSRYEPKDYLYHIGKQQYEEHKEFLWELSVIFKYVVNRFLNEEKDAPKWEFTPYLDIRREARNKQKKELEREKFYQSFKTPPNYTKRTSGKYMPSINETSQRSLKTGGSYHSTSPRMVDDLGNPYIQDSGGGRTSNKKMYKQNWRGKENPKQSTPSQRTRHSNVTHHSNASGLKQRHPYPKTISYHSKDKPNKYDNSSVCSGNSRHSDKKSAYNDSDGEHQDERYSVYKRHASSHKPRPAFGLKYIWDGTRGAFKSYS